MSVVVLDPGSTCVTDTPPDNVMMLAHLHAWLLKKWAFSRWLLAQETNGTSNQEIVILLKGRLRQCEILGTQSLDLEFS